MKAIPLFQLFVVLFVTLGQIHAEKILVGDEIASLKTKSGREYEQVKIRAILAESVRIAHASGAATIPATELPQYQEIFAVLVPAEPVKLAVDQSLQKSAEPAWLPTSSSEVADCSLFVKVSRGITNKGTINGWNGSAFLCNHGSTTYIYSNAHNFDGAINFLIEDRRGIKYDDFESIEIAGEGQGFWKEEGMGGDIVRIRLKNYRNKALTLDRDLINKKNSIDRSILVTGNAGGRGVITELTGIITNIEEDHIIVHNAKTEHGNSGSPIVCNSNFKVIGILTWGEDRPNSLQEIWCKTPESTREGIMRGAGLAGVAFVPTSFEKLKRQREVMNNLKKDIRILGLLDTLFPTKEGIFVDENKIVMGDYTVGELLKESPNHPVVLELLQLHYDLKNKARGGISMSNQDMFKKYIATYERCMPQISQLRNSLESSQEATFFMTCKLRKSNMLEICRVYEGLCRRNLNWYVTQRGTSAEAIPLDLHQLPSFRSGLAGLGIKE